MNFSYPILKREKADDLYARISQGEAITNIAEEQVVGDGPYILDGVDLLALHRDLAGLWSKCKGTNKAAIFEAEASVIVHSAMPRLPAYVATDPEFWMWLTFIACEGKFAQLVIQRFGKDAQPENFSLGSLPESLYFRLWWRGSRGCDDDYDIARRGDIDLWRSHVIRIESPMSDMMLRAFVKTVMPEPKQIKVPIDQKIIRALAIKITARHASCAYETLTESQCSQLVDSILQEVAQGVDDKK